MKKNKIEDKKRLLLRLKKIDFSNKRVRVFLIIGMFILFASLGALLGISYNKKMHKVSILYRTYTRENGWSKWVSNGQVSGIKGKYISAIQIKVDSKYDGNIFYDTYYEDEWNQGFGINGKTSGNRFNELEGLKVYLSDELHERFKVIYTIHTNDKWKDWDLENVGLIDEGNSIDKVKISIHSYKEFNGEE